MENITVTKEGLQNQRSYEYKKLQHLIRKEEISSKKKKKIVPDSNEEKKLVLAAERQ